MSGGKVITPNVSQWFKPTLESELVRLCKNPTHEQLDIFRRKAEDSFYGETPPGMLVFDLFVLLFKFSLDALPNLPLLTAQKHEALYVRMIMSCLEIACKCLNDVGAQMEERAKVRTLDELINSFKCSQEFWSAEPKQ